MKSGRNESSWGKSSLGKFTAKKLSYSTPNFTYPNPNFKQSKHKTNQFQLDVPLVERVSALSKTELRNKLELELHQVRSLTDRIESARLKRSLPVSLSGNGGEFHEMMCKQILSKLMRNRISRVFCKPVDAVGLGLYDYHHIVKEPMDLGTVKLNLSKNLYSSPSDFASDVRLTFNNAMLYNPKTDQVHSMAAQLLSQFEDMFGPVHLKMDSNVENDGCRGTSWNEVSTSERPKKPKTNLVSSIPIMMMPDLISKPLVQSSASNLLDLDTPSVQLPVLTTSPVPAQPVKSTGSVKAAVSTVKQPKPKAKDINKRAMTTEEKHKLGEGLQNLPEEKMPQLVQIIRKRNEHLAEEDDEIELDMEALDTETLWELDRFVTNWKKFESKTKRQALMETIATTPMVAGDTDEALASSDINDGEKKIKKGDAGEDVDIGNEMPESTLRHVEVEKDDGGNVHDNADMNVNVNASSSSSSSGSSSSDSSSSDSGSLLGTDAGDEVQS